MAAQTEPSKSDGLLSQDELKEIRDRTLAGLKIGKQSATYKAVRIALDKFIEEL